MEKLQDSSRRAARWRAAIQILSLPLLGSATASNLFGQCTQENSRVEENICSEKRPIKLLFSSSSSKRNRAARRRALGCFAAAATAQDFCVLLLYSHYFCKITLARGEKISVILMHYKKLLQYSRLCEFFLKDYFFLIKDFQNKAITLQ